ncbi:integrin alpha-9-like isoform X1 [Osmia bicornis bicornis]|uniref:integrin alpha-9-like isoform X1 n=1 Tax=Osmia bicornis bicornis TaxID=1437191 RepID=UPI001EAF3ABF|nr:integrin alpha-9-like isoform X1 [Osmia bicornis bicornis]
MNVKVIFLLLIKIVHGYNIDVDFPIIYSRGNTMKNSDSYFGYAVYLFHESSNSTSWLFIGAPRGNYSRLSKHMLSYMIEPGVVYRCGIENEKCQEIKPQTIENEEERIAQLGMNMLIKKQHGWFGSAMSIDKLNRILTVCAPRTVVTIFNPAGVNMDTMQGMCYSGMLSSNSLSLEYKDIQFHDFQSKFWYNPLHGFTVHYASSTKQKDNKDGEERKLTRIVGEPKHENYGTIHLLHANRRMTIELPLSDELSQFGYSVESGYFFRRDQVMYVSGAPGWHYIGQVGIIDPVNGFTVTKLYGTDIGEFFGASLAVGDLNNDGLDDLLIGAPYWGEDSGRVYTYFGTSRKGQFEMAATLEGNIEGGHFGYAIASGDLDADGFDDIIVGAPWEEYGVIYIYNGGSNLKDRSLQASQRIDVAKFSQFNRPQKIQRFGFSMSKPVDIDENGYLDIAVGAYKSGHAVILRGRPVVKTELEIQTTPNILQRDAKQFLINVCPRYIGYKVPSSQEFKITLTIDERYQRTKKTTLELKSFYLKIDMCLSAQINISKNVQDFIEPISIFAKHDFLYNNVIEFCKLCPVERRNNKQQVAQTLLPFNIGCGEDRVCNSNISANGKFYDVHDNNTWIIGSNDISLEISLKNHGEPAYLTTIEFLLPKGVILRSILTSCQEDTFKEHLLVICEAGNPIWEREEKNVKLDLDMRHLINDSIHDYKLNFHARINTRSINFGTKNINKTLNLVNEVSLSLHGKANEEAYYLTTSNDIAPNISFQHTYQVYKLGASPIEDAQLTIKVPIAIRDSKILVYIYKPQLYVSGERFECSTENILFDTEMIEMQGEPSSDQFDIPLFSNKIQQNEFQELYRRDANESMTEFYDVENTKALQALNESLTTNTVYMNCSSTEVNCTTIVCDLNALKTLQDIGKIVIKLFLYTEGLKDDFKDGRVVLKFSSQASVKVIKPTVRLDVNGTRSALEVVTMFYNAPKVEELKLWIVLVSVSIGLLLLLIIIIILSTLGFFKRKGKQDLTDLKNNEITEKETTPVTESDN